MGFAGSILSSAEFMASTGQHATVLDGKDVFWWVLWLAAKRQPHWPRTKLGDPCTTQAV